MSRSPADPKDALLAWAYRHIVETTRRDGPGYPSEIVEFLTAAERLFPGIVGATVVVHRHADQAVRDAEAPA